MNQANGFSSALLNLLIDPVAWKALSGKISIFCSGNLNDLPPDIEASEH